jgi:DNA transposition AAA+ family ATPase
VVIDEFDHVSAKLLLVEALRDLSDLSEVPFVFVGMGKVRDNLKRLPQVSSRVARYVTFEPSDQQDVQKFLDEQCEVKVAPDLAAFVTKVTGGYNREVREAIVSIERFGFRVDPGEIGLTLADMAGQFLTNDRYTGQAIYVPEAR